MRVNQETGKENNSSSMTSEPVEVAKAAEEAAPEPINVEQPENEQFPDFPMDDSVFDHNSFRQGLEDNDGIMTTTWCDLPDFDWNRAEKQIESSTFQHSHIDSGIHSNASPARTANQDTISKPLSTFCFCLR